MKLCSIIKCCAVFIICMVTILSVKAQDEDVWRPRLDGIEFRLGGQLEMEYVDTENDTGIGNPNGHFQLDTFYFQPTIKFDDTFKLQAYVYFGSTWAVVGDVYLWIYHPYLNSSFRIGLGERFIWGRPSQKTEAYLLLDNIFARLNNYGVNWYGSSGNYKFYLSIANGYHLGTIRPAEDFSYNLINDNFVTNEDNENKEIGAGLERRFRLANENFFDVLVFYFQGRLSEGDKLFLQAIDGYGTSGDDANYFYGTAMEYKFNQLLIGGKYISCKDGTLNRDGVILQASYTIFTSADRKKFIEPYIGFSSVNVGLPNSPGDILTWDRQMTILALFVQIAPGVMIRNEYYMNNEDTGNGDVDNDELCIHLRVKF